MIPVRGVRVTIARSHFAYAPFYCEENVWRLAADPRIPGEKAHVVFVSNSERCCALWSQRAAPDVEAPVFWDYHVIYLAVPDKAALVYDLDSTLDFPSAFEVYVKYTFRSSRFPPRFRVIEADEFRRRFSSDRSHMRDAGRWKSPPPPWPCIRSPQEAMNLHRFIDMEAPFLGKVCDLEGLRSRFSGA